MISRRFRASSRKRRPRKPCLPEFSALVAFPPSVLGPVEHSHGFMGDVAGPSCLELVRVLLLYNAQAGSIASRIAGMNAHQWTEAIGHLDHHLTSLDDVVAKCKHELICDLHIDRPGPPAKLNVKSAARELWLLWRSVCQAEGYRSRAARSQLTVRRLRSRALIICAARMARSGLLARRPD